MYTSAPTPFEMVVAAEMYLAEGEEGEEGEEETGQGGGDDIRELRRAEV